MPLLIFSMTMQEWKKTVGKLPNTYLLIQTTGNKEDFGGMEWWPPLKHKTTMQVSCLVSEEILCQNDDADRSNHSSASVLVLLLSMEEDRGIVGRRSAYK